MYIERQKGETRPNCHNNDRHLLTCAPSCLQEVFRHVAAEVFEQCDLLVEGLLRVGAERVKLLTQVTVNVLDRPGRGGGREGGMKRKGDGGGEVEEKTRVKE